MSVSCTNTIAQGWFIEPCMGSHGGPWEPGNLAVQAGLSVYQAVQQEVDQLEHAAFTAVKLSDDYKILQTTTGIGKILGLTIMLETGDIHRFSGPGNYASYCRCVESDRRSNGKTKDSGNAKAGNPYLSWAFSEAAHFAVRFEPLAQRFYERKKAKTNGFIPTVLRGNAYGSLTHATNVRFLHTPVRRDYSNAVWVPTEDCGNQENISKVA